MSKYNQTAKSLDPYQWQAIPFPPQLMTRGTHKPAAYRKATKDGTAIKATGILTVYVAKQDGQWHLSLTHHSTLTDALGMLLPGRVPTIDELKDARYRFIPDSVTMVLYLPPTAESAREHPTTLHLWEVEVKVSQASVSKVGASTKIGRTNR